MNCAGINAHFIDIEADDKILEADIIHLLETSLDENKVNQLRLQGYGKHLISVGNGNGITTYFKDNIFSQQQDVKDMRMQVTQFTSIDVDML